MFSQSVPPSNPRFQDLSGCRFGRLTVHSYFGKIDKVPTAAWNCVCDCGNTLVCTSIRLKTGNTKSCGCIRREVTHRLNLKHGCARVGNKTREYETWKGMHKRCENPSCKDFHQYGGRGIRVCARWSGDGGFDRFLQDVGKRPSSKHSLDRIDVNGDYEPKNCRWATQEQQSRNKRQNRILSLNGESMCLVEWSEKLNISYTVLRRRVQLGWSDEEALTTPVRFVRKKHGLL